jgi:outer membrane receptor protein involved in Fe transport
VVDGMDNQAPGLNFSVGNIVGLTELDVESMELLPGASSALYGPGGMNGTVIVNSKNPFKYQGFSLQIKNGIMHTDQRQRKTAPYYDWSARWAKVIGSKFAFKLNAQLVQAKDWIGDDYSNYKRIGSTGSVIAGDRISDPNYDGINVYGDETSLNGALFAGGASQIAALLYSQRPAASQPISVPAFIASMNNALAALPATLNISRSGFRENELLDNNTTNFKLSGGLFYKLTNNTELSLISNWGTGTTVYTGSERYSIKDFKMGQHKLEVKSKNWFVRGYTTQENAGESHNSTITAQLLNELWKKSFDPLAVAQNPALFPNYWFPQYMIGFLTAKALGQSDAVAHATGRGSADGGRPVPGTTQFRNLYDQVRKAPIPQGGLLLDRSDLWGAEGQYNFQNKIKFVDVLVGANWRQYVLNSQGTLFIDYTKPIKINEVGGYIQLTKKLLNDRLTLSASGRYDKNDNFKGRFTPRATAVVRVAKNNNIRLSYQTAYRFPTTQQQYINLVVGSGVFLAGGLPWVQDLYNLKTNRAFQLENVLAGNFFQPNSTNFNYYNFKEFKPEVANTYEVGYKGLFGSKFLLDAYGYYAKYQDFIGRVVLLQRKAGPITGPADLADLADASKRNAISITTNSDSKVTTWGYGVSMDYNITKFWAASFNISSDNIEDVPTGFVSNFNTPKYRFNIGLTNTGVGKSKLVGFGINLRWQDEVNYESDFAQGLLPSFTVVDAQVNYKITEIRSMIKLGANNLLNKYYRNGFGNPSIGGIYYVSFAYNVF